MRVQAEEARLAAGPGQREIGERPVDTGGLGALAKVGVEGTGSYGAGLARYLGACGVEVAEVIRPNRQARRQRGKSDTADAVAAALAALNGEAAGVPKAATGRWSQSGR
jgi:transposase